MKGRMEQRRGMAWRAALVCAACCLAMGTAGAQDETPETFEEVLALVQQSANDIKSWEADLTMEMVMQGMMMQATGTMQGKGEMTATDLSVSAGPQEMAIKTVLDKNGIQWTQTQMENMNQVMKVDTKRIQALSTDALGMEVPMGGSSPMAMSQSPSELLQAYGEMYDMEVTGTETQNGVKVYNLRGTMKDAAKAKLGKLQGIGLSMGDVMVSVGAGDGFIRQLKMLDENGEPMVTMNFQSVELNAGVEDSVFQYSPPEGAQVMDMTQMIESRLKNNAGEGGDSEETP